MIYRLLLAFVAVGAFTAITSAADSAREAGAPVVAIFQTHCFGQPNNIGTIIDAKNVDAGLRSIDVPSEFVNRKIDVAAAWSLDIENRPYELIVLHRPEFKNSGIQCILRSPDNGDSIFPYLDPFKRAVETNGVKGREIDLPHFFLARGKVADGRHAEARLLTRFALPNWPGRYTTLWVMYA